MDRMTSIERAWGEFPENVLGVKVWGMGPQRHLRLKHLARELDGEESVAVAAYLLATPYRDIPRGDGDCLSAAREWFQALEENAAAAWWNLIEDKMEALILGQVESTEQGKGEA